MLAEPVAEATRELAAEAAEESAELAAEAAELIAAEADAAAELAAEAAADVAAATEEGIATEMPAALQIPARADGTSVRWLGWSVNGENVASRTGSVIGRAAGGNARLKGAGDGGLTSSALACHVGDTATRCGDGGDKAGNLSSISASSQFGFGSNIQRSQGWTTSQEPGQRQRRARSQMQRW